MNYQTFLTIELKKAADTARQYFGKVTSSSKPRDNNQVLTEADTVIGKQLVVAIEQAFPRHNIIDEEAGVIDKKSNFTWVVDPIDGTSNFAAGLPHYGIMIGLLDGVTPIVGGIALPYYEELYLAEKGKGTSCNGRPIRVSGEQQLLTCLVSYGIDGHQENPALTEQECAILAKIILASRNLRTSNSAFDMAMVASGHYGAYLNQTTKIWDNVAPHIIVEEAGGVWTTFDGAPFDYSNAFARADENFSVCAANPVLHKQLQAIIHAT